MNMTIGLTVKLILTVHILCENVAFVRLSPIVGGEPIPPNGTHFHLSKSNICVLICIAVKAFSFAASLQMKEVNDETGEISYKHFCGGALIQNHNRIGHVLTASHCVMHM